MDALEVYPQNIKQLHAIKAVLKALDIPFKKVKPKDHYDPEFVKKIRESEQQIKEGNVSIIKNKKELKKFLDKL